MIKRLIATFLVVVPLLAADKDPARALIEMAGRAPEAAQFHEALLATLGADDLKNGEAIIGRGEDFLWAIESARQPSLVVDDSARPGLKRVGSTDLWFAVGKLKTGTLHSFYYLVGGEKFGGQTDVPAYGPDSYPNPGVPQGQLSPKLVHASKLYDGMQSDYWVYAPAEYDAKTPAALMVWQDGQVGKDRNGRVRILDVIDNLTYQKKIPVMIQVFVSPGRIGNESMRSFEYDTMSDKYARFLRDELLPEVQSKYNLRGDAYSRGISGMSSGGICAFNVAWEQPDQFSRVLSWVGSFTSIQWQPGIIDGGNVYPSKARKDSKRNVRVWLQDGSEDLEDEHGSWPLQNIQLANSLKYRDYDIHLSFGHGTHNAAHGSAELPEALTWLWRDYDPSKTEQIYEMEPAERAKPLYRVKIYNRSTGL